MTLAAVRVWNDIRSFHVEFDSFSRDQMIVYRKKSYDFHPEVFNSAGVSIRELGTFATCILLLRQRPRLIELNEPLMVPVWPRLALLTAVGGLVRILRRRTQVVGYAIENLDPVDLLRSKLRMPSALSRAIVWLWLRWCGLVFTKIAFGTAASQRLYVSRGLSQHRTETRMIEQLPSACSCGPPRKLPGHVVFVGSFDGRKGASQLIEAWSVLMDEGFCGGLTMIGDGPDFVDIASRAEASGGSVLRNPPRADIHEVLRTARVLVLLSQPHPRWREQVGLPILEGLGHGAVIVASTETGLANWLVGSGHFAISPNSSASVLAQAIRSAVDSPMSPADVLESLPPRHGRAVAADWLSGRS